MIYNSWSNTIYLYQIYNINEWIIHDSNLFKILTPWIMVRIGQTLWTCHRGTYSKVSIKRPVLLNDLVWIFPEKSLSNDQVHLRKNWPYCFISGLPQLIFGLYQTTWFGYLEKVSMKKPVLSFFQILEAYNDQVL